MKKIQYVSLESGAFLSDLIFQAMNAEERGVYCSLIFYLYENNGRLPLDFATLGHLCNCQNFEKVWEFIRQKFLVRKNIISHKRVIAELEKARQFLQGQSEKGVKGMNSRWHSDNTAITKRSEEKRSEGTESNNSNTNGSQFQSVLSSLRSAAITPAELETLRFRIYDILCGIFKGRTPSDTTAIRNLVGWARNNIAEGKFEPQIFKTIVNMAVESKNGKSRKPIAVFFAQVKRDLGYKENV